MQISIDEYSTISSIEMIILQTKSGITIYEEQFNRKKQDAGLISGYMNVISIMFDDMTSVEGTQIQKYETDGTVITIHQLPKSDLIIIADESLSSSSLNNLIDAHKGIEMELASNYFTTTKGLKIPPKSRIEDIFAKFNVKISLLGYFQTSTTQITQLLKSTSLSDKFRTYLNLLHDFSLDNSMKDYFVLKELISYLDDNHVSTREIQNCVNFLLTNNLLSKHN